MEEYKQKKEIPNLMFAGLAGGGKSSLAKIIVNELLDCQYLYINASDRNGIDTVRVEISSFAQTKSIDGKLKVVILDEADGLTPDGQRALRNTMEEFSDNVRFILTCNQKYRVIGPIQSRTQVFDIVPPLSDCVEYVRYILTQEGISVPPEQKAKLISQGYSEQGAKVQEVTAKLEENKKKTAEVSAQFELENRKIILGYLERKLTADGTLTDDELNWLLEKGQAWGMYSEEAIAAMQAAMDEANNLIDTYNSIPTYINTNINTSYTTTGNPPTTIGPPGVYASGGEVYAGNPVTVGEAGKETFMPSQNGRILGHAESLHAMSLGGGSNYFYGNVTLQISEDAAGGLLEYR